MRVFFNRENNNNEQLAIIINYNPSNKAVCVNSMTKDWSIQICGAQPQTRFNSISFTYMGNILHHNVLCLHTHSDTFIQSYGCIKRQNCKDGFDKFHWNLVLFIERTHTHTVRRRKKKIGREGKRAKTQYTLL